MMKRPMGATGRRGGPRREIPMKIIAADGREKYKSQEPARRSRPQQQPARLPDHNYGADGNIKAAENKIVGYFPEHVPC